LRQCAKQTASVLKNGFHLYRTSSGLVSWKQDRVTWVAGLARNFRGGVKVNAWFRLWAEFEDDPKVQMMPEEMQRRLVLLFCERCKGEFRTEQQRAFKMHITLAQLGETKACFIEAGIIDEKWELVNWNKRQFISDSSTDRVKKHRANQALKQDETLQVTDVKQSVTPPDTDTDTDSEADTKQKHKKPFARSVPPDELAGTLPLANGTDFQVSKSDVDRWVQAFPGVSVKQELKKFKAWCEDNPTRKKTAKGVKSAVFRWLDKAQNSGGGNGTGEQSKKRTEGNAGAEGGEDGPDLYAALYGTVEQGKLN
jgi:hypothetical protein